MKITNDKLKGHETIDASIHLLTGDDVGNWRSRDAPEFKLRDPFHTKRERSFFRGPYPGAAMNAKDRLS